MFYLPLIASLLPLFLQQEGMAEDSADKWADMKDITPEPEPPLQIAAPTKLLPGPMAPEGAPASPDGDWTVCD